MGKVEVLKMRCSNKPISLPYSSLSFIQNTQHNPHHILQKPYHEIIFEIASHPLCGEGGAAAPAAHADDSALRQLFSFFFSHLDDSKMGKWGRGRRRGGERKRKYKFFSAFAANVTSLTSKVLLFCEGVG